MTCFNLLNPSLHTPDEPVPEHAFYVGDHLVIVKKCRFPYVYNTSNLYLRRVSDWIPY